MKLVSVAEMVAIERQADSSGLTFTQMMENAGTGLAEAVQDLDLEPEDREVFGLVGPGNNGGDTLVALSHLAADGWRARAYLIKRKSDTLVERFERVGGESVYADQDPDFANLEVFVSSASVLLDGVLGTGAQPPVKGDLAPSLAAVQRILAKTDTPPYVIAVDCPSGVNCDTGEVADESIAADLTITMAAVKQGLLRMPAYALAGDLQVVDIGLPPDLQAVNAVHTEVAEAEIVASLLPERPPDAHKGTFGTALVVAGSVNYTGAAWLAAKAAYRAGAGLVTLAVPSPLQSILAGQLAEATWLLLPHELGVISRAAADVVLENLGHATAVLIGPGFGLEDTTREFVSELLLQSMPAVKSSGRMGFLQSHVARDVHAAHQMPAVVFDADGLKLLARIPNWHTLLPAPAILTPHPGEMAVLTGLSKEDVQRDRQGVAEKFARDWGHVVILKGAFTVVAAPDGRTTIIPIASAALARAGTGDVLSGLVVGLRAQGVDSYSAAVAGAWIHAQAGLYAARQLGTTASVMAGDVLDCLPKVMAEL